MNERDLIATQTIRFVSEGGDAVRANIKAIASAQGELAAASQNLGVVTETSARRQTSAAAAFQALEKRADPATRALAEFEAAQRRVSMALDQGVVSQGRALEVLGMYAQKANAAAVAQENLRRQQSNASVNQGQGFNPSAANSSTYAAQFEAAAKAQEKQVTSINSLRSAMRPLEVEQGKLGEEMVYYRGLLKSGAISSDEFAEKQVMLGKRLGDVSQNLRTAGTAGRVMSGEMTNLGFQLNDVVTGLALGQSPFMILAQQGGQIVQIFTSSKASIADFAKSSISWLTGLFTATRVAIGGAAGLGAGMLIAAADWQSAQKDIERSLVGVGARTGTTVADVNKFASANASATGLSVDQARSSAIEFTKTGMIAVGQLKGLGDAVHGYSILTGKDATDATKDLARALSGDLVKGAQDLNRTYGFLNPAMEDNIRKLVNQGERAKAQQVIINAMAADNKKAEDTVGSLAKAWDAVWNAASRAKNAIGQAMTESPDEELQRLTRLQERRALPGRGARIDELRGQKTAGADSAFSTESARIQTAGRSAVEGVLPGIKQVEQLEQALGNLRRAKEDANAVGIKLADNGAEQIYKNIITATQQGTAETVRYNERVAAISISWGNVSQSVALTLQHMNNQLPVAQAWTESGRIRAQYQATYNDLLDQGKTKQEATAIASKQEELSKAAAVASAEKLVQSSQDNLDNVRAQGTGMEAVVASSIAYRDAMQAGATASQAAAISANTLAASLIQAQQAADKVAVDAANAATQAALAPYLAAAAKQGPFGQNMAFDSGNGNQNFTAEGGDPRTNAALRFQAQQESRGVQGLVDTSYSGGDLSAALNAAKNAPNTYGADLSVAWEMSKYGYDLTKILGPQRSNIDDKITAVDNLTQLQNAQTTDKSVQVSNLQSEMAWLQTLPETIARDQKIVSLQQSIDSLKSATDANTAATQATLNPLYSQGHGALAIGYYKAASGLDLIAQGPTSGDQIPFHAMVNGGERIQIGPANQGNNDNSKSITVNQYFSGGSTNTRRRSQRQALQGFAQSMAAAG